jgi:hypothetical protein
MNVAQHIIHLIHNEPMTDLIHPLTVLAKAVAFKNLSAASLLVGLSQPQLSRLVARLEAELGFELLNRQARRNSSWTPQALQLAETFTRHQRRLELSLRGMQGAARPKALHMGTLEGLADLAMQFAETGFQTAGLELVELDIYDRGELEAKFLAGELDVILNTRIPNRTKPRFLVNCGYQWLETTESPSRYRLFSSFEYSRLKKRPMNVRTLVSNSLFVRKSWQQKYGGSGAFPSSVQAKGKRGMDEVLLLGGEWLDANLWKALTSRFHP